MYNGAMGEIIIAVSCLGDPVREINILSVHEEGLIQVAGLFQGFFSQKHKSTCQHIHGMGKILIQMSQVVFPKTPGPWKERCEPEHFIKGDFRCGKSTF